MTDFVVPDPALPTLNSEPPIAGVPGRGTSTGPRCDIQLQNPCRYPEAGARRLRPWLEPVVGELAPGRGSLAVRFVSDREMRRLNATYRHRDQPTDVLSFPGPQDLPGGERHLGDVAISVPAARRQARRLGHGVDTELRVLLLHGVLHCLGYDHETDGGVMDELEGRLRRRFIGDPSMDSQQPSSSDGRHHHG